MSKERLEKAKKILNHIKGYGVYDGNDDIEIFEWLIEQAQRSLYLEEREKEIIDINQHETQYRQELESINMELTDVLKQNKRYREALDIMLYHADNEEVIRDVYGTFVGKVKGR